jgi:hypothetical protein
MYTVWSINNSHSDWRCWRFSMLQLELILCAFCFSVCQILFCGNSSPVCQIVFHLVLAVCVCSRRRLSLAGDRVVYTRAHKNDRLEKKQVTTSSDAKYPWNAGLFLLRYSNVVPLFFTHSCRATITRPLPDGIFWVICTI